MCGKARGDLYRSEEEVRRLVEVENRRAKEVAEAKFTVGELMIRYGDNWGIIADAYRRIGVPVIVNGSGEVLNTEQKLADFISQTGNVRIRMLPTPVTIERFGPHLPPFDPDEYLQ